MSLDINLLRITMTVVSFVVFIGILAWTIYPGNTRRFDSAAQLPPDESGR